jgi:menaquinone-dependent protoporphyrinogen oxidase
MKRILFVSMVLLAARASDAKEVDVRSVLIVYGSYAGSTAEIADSMKVALGRTGVTAYTIPASGLTVDLSPYDLVVIGGAVRGAKVHEGVLKFVSANRAALEKKPVAVFVACITATSSKADRRKAAEAYPNQVAAGLPVVSLAVFAGKAPPSGWFGNLMGKLVLGITPGDYRDWKKIEDWAVSLPGLALQPGRRN